MHRIDSNGATNDNLFTEGNAALSVPATVVSAAIMNDIQEEVIKPIEAVGIALAKGTRDQLFNAILEIIKRGGRVSPIQMAIANNQLSAADVTNFPQMDKAVVLGFEFLVRLYRKTDSQNVVETGRVYITWNEATATWEITQSTVHGDAEVTFSMALVSGTNYKLQYTSTNYSGSSYTSDLRITDIKVIRA